jgi:hypothetical protein
MRPRLHPVNQESRRFRFREKQEACLPLRSRYDSINMAAIPIPVDLPGEACEVALGPALKGASISSGSRAAIQRAVPHPAGISYRKVTCVADEAQDLLQYFQTIADNLIVLEKASDTVACAVAADNLRLALRLAGVSPSR